MKRDATMSPCGQFRYELYRHWGDGTPGAGLVYVMLNPSTADANIDDPTIRKCIGFAKRNECVGIAVFNLFAYRATSPKDLKSGGYQVGPDNDDIMMDALTQAHESGVCKIVCAWGANARDQKIKGRVEVFQALCQLAKIPLHYLQLTKDGIPCHPLMLPYTCHVTPWEQ